MRVLHYYTYREQSMITDYVAMLRDGMGIETCNELATRQQEAIEKLRNVHYDILHVHGCWHHSAYMVVREAFKCGSRLVLSPHGELEPWVIENNYWKEKLPKKILYQRAIVKKAYAIVVQGKMEEECLRKLGWNSRLIIIRNCLITNTISQKEMAQKMSSLYRKIMDSNTLELMMDDTRRSLRQLIKMGITTDQRWLDDTIEVHQWREVFCYAYQEHIYDVIQRSINLLKLDTPEVDCKQIDYFVPDGFQESVSIGSAIGSSFASENDRLIATFRYLRKLYQQHTLAIAHLIELDRELRFHDCDEEALAESLEERSLDQFAARLMQLMSELTGFTEGYMPLKPLNDRTTRQMRKQLDNHLKI